MQSKKENETDAKSKRSADKPPRWFKTVEPLKGCKMKNKNRSESKKKKTCDLGFTDGEKAKHSNDAKHTTSARVRKISRNLDDQHNRLKFTI